MKRIRVDDLHKTWTKGPESRREYKALEKEFSLAAALTVARARAGLTQEQVAHRMKTTQGVVARLEGGGSKPSTRTLERYAEATGRTCGLASSRSQQGGSVSARVTALIRGPEL